MYCVPSCVFYIYLLLFTTSLRYFISFIFFIYSILSGLSLYTIILLFPLFIPSPVVYKNTGHAEKKAGLFEGVSHRWRCDQSCWSCQFGVPSIFSPPVLEGSCFLLYFVIFFVNICFL